MSITLLALATPGTAGTAPKSLDDRRTPTRTAHKRGPANVECPDCFSATRVCDSRRVGPAVRRRRICHACGLTFTTVETAITADDIAATNRRRVIDELATRFLAMGPEGQSAVRHFMAAIEEAETRGARHEAAAAAAEAAGEPLQTVTQESAR